MTMNKRKRSHVYYRLADFARQYWSNLSGILILGLISTPLALLVPIPLKICVDTILGSDPLPAVLQSILPDFIYNSKTNLLIVVVLLQVLVVFLIHLQALALYVLQTLSGEKITLQFRSLLFNHIKRLSFSFHDTRGHADSIYRLQYDAASIQHILIYGMIPLFTSVVTLVSMIYIIFRINVLLTVVALAVIPPLFWVFYSFSKKMKSKYHDTKRMESRVFNIIHEVMSTFRVVKAFGRENLESSRFYESSNKTILKRINLAYREGRFNLTVNVIIGIGGAIVLFVGAKSVMDKSLSVGELLIVLSYMTQLYNPVKGIGKQAATMQNSFVSAQRAFELLDETPDVIEKDNPVPLKQCKGDFEFQNVSFSYENGKKIIDNISFTIKKYSKVGIVGKTGSGKTTFVSLLPRFYDPESGAIFLDNTNLKDYRISDLRNQFSIVLQETVLFSSSIAENISYACNNVSIDEIIKAAKRANIHDFIMGLPDGYNTLAGEGGMKLSGGERQRIALARAFIKDSPILILDEPTSSVDVKTEKLIFESINKLIAGKTSFIITHRVNTLRECDVIIEFDKGKIINIIKNSQKINN